MNLILTKDTICNKNFYYGKKLNNTIIPNSYFHNLYYYDENVEINNIYFKLDITDITIDEYFNKYKCKFDVNKNIHLIELIMKIEDSILTNFQREKTLIKDSKLSKQFYDGEIKFNSQKKIKKSTSIQLLLKMSGVWYNKTTKGIIFKFMI